MSDRSTFVYVTYIAATAERVWDALTDPDLTARFWGHSNVSDWRPGSPWEHRRTDGSGVADAGGTVLEAAPPRRLVMTFGPPDAGTAPGDATRVTFTIESHGGIVRLSLVHEDLPSPEDAEIAAAGWSAVFANLKTLLETGDVLPQAPWEMPAGRRDAAAAPTDAGHSGRPPA